MKYIFSIVGIMWAGIALLVFGDALSHLIQGTSSFRSQFLRMVVGACMVILASSLVWRYRGWRLIAGLLALLAAFREYVGLAVPLEIELTVETARAISVLLLSFVTVVLVLVGAPRQ